MAGGTAVTGSDGLSDVTNRPVGFGGEGGQQLLFREVKAASDVVGSVVGFVNGCEC